MTLLEKIHKVSIERTGAELDPSVAQGMARMIHHFAYSRLCRRTRGDPDFGFVYDGCGGDEEQILNYIRRKAPRQFLLFKLPLSAVRQIVLEEFDKFMRSAEAELLIGKSIPTMQVSEGPIADDRTATVKLLGLETVSEKDQDEIIERLGERVLKALFRRAEHLLPEDAASRLRALGRETEHDLKEAFEILFAHLSRPQIERMQLEERERVFAEFREDTKGL
jgi:hypothetical protein